MDIKINGITFEIMEKALEQVPKSVKILAPLVDYHVELLNAPNADDIVIVNDGETWETFQSQWIQYVSILALSVTCSKRVSHEKVSLNVGRVLGFHASGRKQSFDKKNPLCLGLNQ